MKAKELAKELVVMESYSEIMKKLINTCQDKFLQIQKQRYPKGFTEQIYKDIFKEVNAYFISVVNNMMKLDPKFKDFSGHYREVTNQSISDNGFNFKV